MNAQEKCVMEFSADGVNGYNTLFELCILYIFDNALRFYMIINKLCPDSNGFDFVNNSRFPSNML